MKNSEMPTMPCSAPDKGAREELLRALKETGDFTVPEIKDIANKLSLYRGLTKREHFAATINHQSDSVQFNSEEAIKDFIGWIPSTDNTLEYIRALCEIEAKIRVMRADALLAELEKTS